MIIRIEYAIETIDDGWLVWRRVGEGDLEAVSIGAHAITFVRRVEAEQAIEMQRQHDRAAGTRLGVTVKHPPTVCP